MNAGLYIHEIILVPPYMYKYTGILNFLFQV